MSLNDQRFEAIREQLDNISWPEGIDTMTPYRVPTDDSDGKANAPALIVTFSEDGDAWVETTGIVRIRTYFGGGRWHLIRAALLVLAWAIKTEQEEVSR